jgi:SAM-dependent methyltransferase
MNAMKERTDWEAYSAAAEVMKDIEPGPAQRYTQMQCLQAFREGLKRGRRASERDGDKPLAILQTDLWTESVARNRQLLEGALHLALDYGYFTSYRSTCGIDIAAHTCRLADSQTKAHIAQADIRALPFRSGTFDLIFDPSTVDHVPYSEAEEVMDGYYRVLKPGGVLVMIYSHYEGTLRRESGESYYVFPCGSVRYCLGLIGFDVLEERAICALNTQPAGRLTSGRLHMAGLMYSLFTWLEFTWVSGRLLRRVSPLWVVIARKREVENGR